MAAQRCPGNLRSVGKNVHSQPFVRWLVYVTEWIQTCTKNLLVIAWKTSACLLTPYLTTSGSKSLKSLTLAFKVKACALQLKPTFLKCCNFYFEGEQYQFPVCAAVFTVSLLLKKQFASVCKQVGIFHTNYKWPKQSQGGFWYSTICLFATNLTQQQQAPFGQPFRECTLFSWNRGVIERSLGLHKWGFSNRFQSEWQQYFPTSQKMLIFFLGGR